MAQYFNCGYARVAAYEIAKKLSTTNDWTRLRNCNEEELVSHFQRRFHQRKEFAITNTTYFTRNLRSLLPMFSRRWNPTSARGEYHSHFSEHSWKKLTQEAKDTHSLKRMHTFIPTYSKQLPRHIEERQGELYHSITTTIKEAQKG